MRRAHQTWGGIAAAAVSAALYGCSTPATSNHPPITPTATPGPVLVETPIGDPIRFSGTGPATILVVNPDPARQAHLKLSFSCDGTGGYNVSDLQHQDVGMTGSACTTSETGYTLPLALGQETTALRVLVADEAAWELTGTLVDRTLTEPPE
jgi:hypothetical protein